MKNREIYNAALMLLAEPAGESTEDYLVRAPYILGGFFYENGRLDEEYRKFFGLEERQYTHAVYADLDNDFPFVERFASAAEFYLASMLVIDEDSELSDKFFDKFSSAMSGIIGEIPAICEPIVSLY